MKLNMGNPRRSASGPVRVMVAVIAAMMAFGPGVGAFAATPAGTVIENTATVQFDGGSATSNTVRLTVAQAAGATLSPTTASLNGAPAQTIYFPVTVTNAGNGADSFALTAASQSGWTTQVYRDDNSDGIHQVTETTSLTTTGSIAAGGTTRIFAALNVPSGTADGTTCAVTVKASAASDSTAVATATYTATVSTTPQNAGVTLSPTSGSQTSAPAKTVYFPVTLTNSGTAADSFSLSATSQQGWSAGAYADANNDGIHQETETTVLTTTGSVAASGTVKFFAAMAIPASVANDTQGTISLVVRSATDSTKTAAASYGVTVQATQPSTEPVAITPETATMAALATKTIYFPATITNNSGGTQSYKFYFGSKPSWPMAVHVDSNQDGIHQASETTRAYASASIPAGGSLKYHVAINIPSGTATGTQSIVTFTARQMSNTAIFATVNYTAKCGTDTNPTPNPTTGVSLAPASASQNTAPAKTVYFPVTLTNSGSATDTFTLSVASRQGWTGSLIADSNKDGIRQDTETATVTSTGSLTANGTYRFFAAVAVPSTAANATQDTLTVTARSTADATKTSAASYSVTVQAIPTSGLAITPTTATMSIAPTKTIYFPATITNYSGGTQSYKFYFGSSPAWPMAVHVDANSDGIHQASETTRAYASASIPAGGSLKYHVAINIPSGTALGTQSIVTFTARQMSNTAIFATAKYTAVASTTTTQSASAQATTESTGTVSEASSTTQTAVTDVNLDGTVNLIDVMKTQAAETGTAPTAIATGTRQLALTDAVASPGATVPVEVTIDNGAQVAGIEATILLESDLLSAVDVKPGELMGDGTDWKIEASQEGAELHILAYNTAGGTLVAGSGTVLEIETQVSQNAQVGDASPLVWGDALAAGITGNTISVQTSDGTLSVEGPGQAAVRVAKYAGGTPLSGAKVEALQAGTVVATGTTDSTGKFIFSKLPAGPCDIHVTMSGYYGKTMTSVVIQSEQMAEVSLSLFTLTKAGTGAIDGLIADQAGNPLQKVPVGIYQGSRKIALLYSNAQGYYSKVGLIPGSYAVVIQMRGYAKVSMPTSVEANEMSSIDIPLTSTTR